MECFGIRRIIEGIASKFSREMKVLREKIKNKFPMEASGKICCNIDDKEGIKCLLTGTGTLFIYNEGKLDSKFSKHLKEIKGDVFTTLLDSLPKGKKGLISELCKDDLEIEKVGFEEKVAKGSEKPKSVDLGDYVELQKKFDEKGTFLVKSFIDSSSVFWDECKKAEKKKKKNFRAITVIAEIKDFDALDYKLKGEYRNEKSLGKELFPLLLPLNSTDADKFIGKIIPLKGLTGLIKENKEDIKSSSSLYQSLNDEKYEEMLLDSVKKQMLHDIKVNLYENVCKDKWVRVYFKVNEKDFNTLKKKCDELKDSDKIEIIKNGAYVIYDEGNI